MKKNILLFIFISLILTCCGTRNTEVTNPKMVEEIASSEEEITTSEKEISSNEEEIAISEEDITTQEDYTTYEGMWSENGMTNQEIIENGGASLQIKIINKTQVEAVFFLQQRDTERFAEIDSIQCKIVNNIASYSFDDDGWNNQGTLYLQFLEDKVKVWTEDFKLSADNVSGYGISGSYELVRTLDTLPENEEDMDLLEQIDKRYYGELTEEELMEEIAARTSFLQASSYYDGITSYRENVQEIRDISNVVLPLFFTDMKYYEEKEFNDCSLEVLTIAKNEIYARHGWIFKDEDLKNYFLGQVWYEPTVEAGNFDDSVFNEYEVYNLKFILKCIETLKQ